VHVVGQISLPHQLPVALVRLLRKSFPADLLATANRKLETLRWLLRLAGDRNLWSGKQYEFSSRGVTKCGRMIGGW